MTELNGLCLEEYAMLVEQYRFLVYLLWGVIGYLTMCWLTSIVFLEQCVRDENICDGWFMPAGVVGLCWPVYLLHKFLKIS